MTAVSFSVNRGNVNSFAANAITVGALAPSAAFDIELRFQVVDGLSKNLNDLDIKNALKMFEIWIATNGILNEVAITTQPSGPPS